MSRKANSFSVKINVIRAWENRTHTITDLAHINNVSPSTIYNWIDRYESLGEKGLYPTSKEYSKEYKLKVVREYLHGGYSQKELVRKYEISSKSVLQKWIKNYNSHRQLKDTSKGRKFTMTNKRKTTLNERIEIVHYYLENGMDFNKAAETFQVSYQQVYQWVKKYENGGEEALQDKRGRKKEEVELSPEQKIQREMQRLKMENERLRAENAFLKKLEEIERRQK